MSGSSNGMELIYATKCSLIYRVRKDGKYFLLKRSAIPGERGRKILRREYELSVGCDHPNIVDVYQYHVHPGEEDSLMMEYVEGRTLSDFLLENPSLKTKKRIFSELLAAVSYLHNRRIIHNDLKPENILISRNGDHLKLIDLGFSDDDAHYEIKTPGHSSAYAAPELKDYGKSDVRSDIYSLGVIMQELFGGRYSSVTNKCQRIDPDKRFQDIESLKNRWQRGFLHILVPGVVLFILVIPGVIGYLVADKHKQDDNLHAFEVNLKDQARELKEQREAHENLLTSYTRTKESVIQEKFKEDNIRNEKRKILDSFRQSLSVITKNALDSIRNCEYPNDMIPIYQNYSIEVKKLYKKELESLRDEEIQGEITSIMYKEFSDFDVEFKKSLEEATARLQESLINTPD